LIDVQGIGENKQCDGTKALAYQKYVLDEVLPCTRSKSDNDFVLAWVQAWADTTRHKHRPAVS